MIGAFNNLASRLKLARAQAIALSTAATRFFFGTAPTICCLTSPPLTITRLGMPRTPKRAGTCGLSSTLIFTTFRRPSYSVASSSTIGAIARQGAHHGAQKSINTGVADFKTSCSKLASVTWKTFSLAIGTSLLTPLGYNLNLRTQADTVKATGKRCTEHEPLVRKETSMIQAFKR